MVIAAAHDAVTNPASAAHSRAITTLTLRWRSSISTNCDRIAATASTASGTTIEAPSPVIVPEALMIGRTPSYARISGLVMPRFPP
jgi:hypothetical protein